MARLTPYAIVAAAWALFVAYAWPGIMTWDSINQLTQARTGNYGNWHPPLMAWMWSLLDGIVAGPALMLVLQTALFAIGLYALFRRYYAPRTAAIVAACVFLFPPVFAPLSGIWKDALMAGLLLCGAAGLASPGRRAHAAAWLAFGIAGALRHNAPLLIVPLTAMIAPYAPAWPVWRRRALGAGLGIAACAAGIVVDRALTRIEEYPFANMIALADTAGVITAAPPLDDAEVRTMLEGIQVAPVTGLQQRIRELNPARIGCEITLADKRVFEWITTAPQADAWVAAWRSAIADHPGAYLAFRWRVFRGALGLTGSRAPPFVTVLDENPTYLGYVGESRDPPAWREAIARALKWIGRAIIFWPLLYLVLGIGLLVILWRDPLQRGLLAGAIAYELALFFLSPGGHEYRYSHWLIVCTVIAAVVRVGAAITDRARSRTQPTPPALPPVPATSSPSS
jgi:hypothetical protein